MPRLAFLHTSPVHIPTFDRLLAEMAPEVQASHRVAEDLLRDARASGITTELMARVTVALREVAAAGAEAVLCTCSTIGACAEATGPEIGLPVLRVDRAMAERAVRLGARVVVVAALESTLAPTADLIMEEARRAGREIQLIMAPCPSAWPAFEAGDQAGYLEAIAAHLRAVAGRGDVVVLAQASMAGAAELCADLATPVLSSPRLGLSAALAALERQPDLDISYSQSPPLTNATLNELFAAAWPDHREADFAPMLERSLAYICAHAGERLVGFVNLAWDGGVHAFLLDTTVHPDVQRCGVGTELVRRAVAAARAGGAEWLHVDYEPHLHGFYTGCGFTPTLAGLIQLGQDLLAQP